MPSGSLALKAPIVKPLAAVSAKLALLSATLTRGLIDVGQVDGDGFAVCAAEVTVRDRDAEIEAVLRSLEVQQAPVLDLDLVADDLEGTAEVVG